MEPELGNATISSAAVIGRLNAKIEKREGILKEKPRSNSGTTPPNQL